MIESSLSKLEQLVSDLVQQKQELLDTNAALNAELAQAKDDNESLQLSLMEQEEKQALQADSEALGKMDQFLAAEREYIQKNPGLTDEARRNGIEDLRKKILGQ